MILHNKMSVDIYFWSINSIIFFQGLVVVVVILICHFDGFQLKNLHVILTYSIITTNCVYYGVKP